MRIIKNKLCMIMVIYAIILCLPLFSKAKMPKIPALASEETVSLQDQYSKLSDSLPAFVMFTPKITAGVDSELQYLFYHTIVNQMVEMRICKPVSLNKWLDKKFTDSKALSIYSLIYTVSNERYPQNIKGLCKPFVFRSGNRYILGIAIYTLNGGGYPIYTLRLCDSPSDVTKYIPEMLSNIMRIFARDNKKKVKVAVAPFEIQNTTLAVQKTGEFDFIKTSFSLKEGIEVKENDDYFSTLFSYMLTSTNLFSATALGLADDYVDSAERNINAITASNADYLIRSKVSLNKIRDIIFVDLVNVSSGKTVKTYTYFMPSFSLDELWKAYSYIINKICQDTLTENNDFKFVENLQLGSKYFYYNDMLIGWNKIDRFPVKKGKSIINTGNSFNSNKSIKSDNDYSNDNQDFFIYSSNSNIQVFFGREGEYIWNLLEK